MLVVFNKPFNVLSQFRDQSGRDTLADYIPIKDIYPCGRLDRDSEGLLLLTDHGKLQQWIANPHFKLPKTYWAQVEGAITQDAVDLLTQGVELNDGITQPAKASVIDEPPLWPRQPPIRERKSIPTSWIALTITEGRNRQVRRMSAAVGFPTLRLIRTSIGPWSLGELEPGHYQIIDDDQLLRTLSQRRDVRNPKALLHTATRPQRQYSGASR
ncbi:MAG: pseudouridine synthase [Gammaproteobacteria bacterium]|jgi:23S rRNA pseudouridine2457 synthase